MWRTLNACSILTFPFFFLSPPKNFPIWSITVGFFLLRPSLNVDCEELADAMLSVSFNLCSCVFFFQNRSEEREDKEEIYFRSYSAHSEPHSEPAPLCSWMVCSSSDSEGRSLKVLSSRPGASREKRRTKWGRGSEALGSAVLGWFQLLWSTVAFMESVTTGLLLEHPLFWLRSASPSPAQKHRELSDISQ